MNYVVQPGDTLWSIASRFGTSVQAIMQANGLTNPNYIYVGLTLYIPIPGPPFPPAPPYPPGPPFPPSPPAPDNLDRRVTRLERQVERLSNEVERLRRRVERLEQQS
ncbi:MAG: LysM peptidoglycan-binding domain-containing protein [Bacillota bacterium]|uniref:LysM domain-containing protein n=1 Tax=Paenibacillus prosopidis TaxID=630520 RepID=A0A368W216_9BACL|nr:LysM domain-containing protein [Paenibacillus prosopidis]RCW49075.1 LysM domain-containing protein [Paenibacillus prosopidis]